MCNGRIDFSGVAGVCLIFLLQQASVLGQTSTLANVRWHTGAAFQRELRLVSGVSWPKNPLRKTVLDYAGSRRIAVFIDRRVDPQQEIRFVGQRGSLEQLLQRLAEQLNLQSGLVGSVVYLGPADSSTKLATLIRIRSEQARKLTDVTRRSLLRKRSWTWDDLTTPQDLLSGLVDEVKLPIHNLELVPYDLWPATALPSLTFIERLTLVLAGFHLTFEIDPLGRSLKVVRMPKSVGIDRLYRVTNRTKIKMIKQQVVGQYETRNKELWVRTTVENHRRIRQLLAGRRVVSGKRRGPRRKYQKLRVKNKTISQILRALALDQQLELVTDPAVRAGLGQRIEDFQATDASLEEVLNKLLRDRGLQFKIATDKLIIQKLR